MIEFYDAVNRDGLFDLQGKAFFVIDTLNTARLTTIPSEVQDFLDQVALLASDDAFNDAVAGVAGGQTSWQSSGASLASALVSSCEKILHGFVENDAAQPTRSLLNSLEYLIANMLTNAWYVIPNVVSASLATGGSNLGDPAIVYSVKRGDGRNQELLLAEVMALEATGANSIRFLAPQAVGDRYSQAWPGGSGTNVTLTPVSAAASLLSNGDFQDVTYTNSPDNWIVVVGTIGANVLMTVPEVQQVVVTGTPSAGYYVGRWVNPAGIDRVTPAIAYNAAGATLQAALRTIPGLEQVTVATSGTSPNFTHVITFVGVAGNINQISILNFTTGGTFTPSTNTGGNDGAYIGRAMYFDSDGATLTAVYHAVTLQPETVYFFHARVKRVGAAAAGEIKIELVDEIAGTVLNDAAGTANVLTIDATTISTSAHDSVFAAFRIKKDVTQPCYLRIRFSVAPTTTANIFFDECALALGKELYPGGPFAQAFSGKTPAVDGDSWTLTLANNLAGKVQTHYQRAFDLAGKRLLLPSVTTTDVVPNSVVG